MKLNFWQWIGLLLFVVGGVLILNKHVTHWWGSTDQASPTTQHP
jgi:hypothetical protein